MHIRSIINFKKIIKYNLLAILVFDATTPGTLNKVHNWIEGDTNLEITLFIVYCFVLKF